MLTKIKESTIYRKTTCQQRYIARGNVLHELPNFDKRKEDLVGEILDTSTGPETRRMVKKNPPSIVYKSILLPQ